MFQKLIRNITNEATDDIMRRLLTEEYGHNLFGMATATEKLSVRAMVEASIRGETGQPLARCNGSPNVQSPWNKIFLTPTQLFSLPTKEKGLINTQVTIGKNANRPLRLEMPIMIAGMSYGASLSLPAKIALAKAATEAGICTNTGESELTKEEREAACLLIGQFNRYQYMNTAKELSKVDAIEVQLGQGAWGGAIPKTIDSEKIGDHLRQTWKLKEGESAERTSRLEGVNTPEDIVNLIENLKAEYDVPVGIKIAATHFIEKELEVIIRTNADFIVIDGAEGGTAGSPPTLQDDMGLPTLYGISRAAKYLENMGVKDQYDLIACGGLKTPGEFLKALALGANAVYIGSIALVAMLQVQAIKVTPDDATPELLLYGGEHTSDFDVEQGTKTLSNFLTSCNEEMKLSLLAMGKTNFSELNRSDLVTVDKDLADCLQIDYAGYPCN